MTQSLSPRAETYDKEFAKAFPADWEKQVLNKYLSVKGDLLDVGCGTGRHVVPLAENGFNIIGVDKDKEFVTAAHNKIKQRGLLNASLVRGEAQKLPLREKFFDYIISMGNVLGDVGIRKKD